MSAILPSQLQKRFIATSMYKRSRHYFDINKLNQIEVKQQQSRRKPYVETNTSSLDNKFEESFVSAQAKLNQRLQTEVDKHQKRFFREDYDQTETNYTFQGRKGKTLDMNKMLSRQYFEKDTRQCKNQSHFCNFQQYKIPNNTIDFTKFLIPKGNKKRNNKFDCNRCKNKLKVNEQSKDELNADITGKIHDKLIFDQSLFKTIVDYKKYNKEKTQRQLENTPQKKYDQILVGQNMTRKRAKGSLLQFYHGMNKWNSAQMDNRLMKQNQYFIKVYNAKNQQKIDWAIVKKKTDLIQKRKQEIMMRKRINDVKGEICDDLYFRRNLLP